MHETLIKVSLLESRCPCAQALDQVQAYVALHRFLRREKVPTDEAPEPEALAAAAASYLQERTMLLGCVQAVLLYAQGERHCDSRPVSSIITGRRPHGISIARCYCLVGVQHCI